MIDDLTPQRIKRYVACCRGADNGDIVACFGERVEIECVGKCRIGSASHSIAIYRMWKRFF